MTVPPRPAHFAQKERRSIVAEGREAGVYEITETARSLTLTRLEILPDFRSRGLASGTIVELRAQAHATKKALAARIAKDDGARRFLERRGFALERATRTHLEMADCDEEDRRWMRKALEQARRGGQRDETPVGAVIVRDGAIIARAYNAPLSRSDPTAHAEIQAIRRAARTAGEQRLPGATMYVTVEPCAMCAGAILHARLDRVVFGAPNAKFGACGSQCGLLSMNCWNHRVAWRGGVLAAESAALLRGYFKGKRD